MRLDQVHWLPDDVLAKADRASMGASLELRTPYLTRELAEFAASVPPSVNLRDGGKLLLRKVLERKLPAFGLGRAKMAFRTPYSEWPPRAAWPNPGGPARGESSLQGRVVRARHGAGVA